MIKDLFYFVSRLRKNRTLVQIDTFKIRMSFRLFMAISFMIILFKVYTKLFPLFFFVIAIHKKLKRVVFPVCMLINAHKCLCFISS